MSQSTLTQVQLKHFISKPHFDEAVVLGSNPDWPRITIVTPSYNQGAYLEQTILSVLNQNYPNLEFIIMDGGSTDESKSIIHKYEKYLAYWCSRPDGGQASALSSGFSHASGEILAWINSDDIYPPNVLRMIGQVMREESRADVCYGNMYVLDESGNLVAERRVVGGPQPLIYLGFRYGGFGVYQPAAFWRRQLYEAVGGINSSLAFCMDNDLFIRFVLHGGKFRFIHSTLSCFRVHPASKSSTLQKSAREESTMLIERHLLDMTSVKAKCIQWAIRMYRTAKYITQGDILYLVKRLVPSPWNWVP